MSLFPYIVCLALIVAAAVLGILAGCVVYPRQAALLPCSAGLRHRWMSQRKWQLIKFRA
jgi:hypothetical protein